MNQFINIGLRAIVLSMLCNSFAWAKTEKATIMLYPTKMSDFYSARENIKEGMEFYEKQIRDKTIKWIKTFKWIKTNHNSNDLLSLADKIQDYEDYYRSINERDNQPHVLKANDVYRALRKKVANIKSIEVLAKMMADSPVAKTIVYNPSSKPNYIMPYSFGFYQTNPMVTILDYEVINSQTNKILLGNNKAVYPYVGDKSDMNLDYYDGLMKYEEKFKQQPVGAIVTEIWRNAMNQMPKTATLTERIEKDLDDFRFSSNKISYISKQEGVADEFADGTETGKLHLNFRIKSSFIPPLREFELKAKYGRFIKGNNEYSPIRGEQQIVKIIPRDAHKSIPITLKDGKTANQLRKKLLQFTYQTFDCTQTGEEVPPPDNVSDFDKTHYTWYKEQFTLRLVDKLSIERDEEILKKDVYFKCPNYYTADVTHSITTNFPMLSKMTPISTQGVQTYKSKQVIHFDYEKQRVANVPLHPFGQATEYSEDFDLDEASCQYVITDRHVKNHPTDKSFLFYSGHLGDFNSDTPIAFKLPPNRKIFFSEKQLKSGDFSYHKKERKKIPELQIAPAVPTTELKNEFHEVTDVISLFGLLGAGLQGSNTCVIGQTQSNLHRWIEEGFVTGKANQIYTYDVTIRRATKGEIKLFEKQQKAAHDKAFVKLNANSPDIPVYGQDLQDDLDFLHQDRERIPVSEMFPWAIKTVGDVLKNPEATDFDFQQLQQKAQNAYSEQKDKDTEQEKPTKKRASSNHSDHNKISEQSSKKRE